MSCPPPHPVAPQSPLPTPSAHDEVSGFQHRPPDGEKWPLLGAWTPTTLKHQDSVAGSRRKQQRWRRGPPAWSDTPLPQAPWTLGHQPPPGRIRRTTACPRLCLLLRPPSQPPLFTILWDSSPHSIPLQTLMCRKNSYTGVDCSGNPSEPLDPALPAIHLPYSDFITPISFRNPFLPTVCAGRSAHFHPPATCLAQGQTHNLHHPIKGGCGSVA